MKFVLIAAAGLVVLLATVLVIAALLIDPNDYRDDIEQAVRENTGRELTIEGDIELGLFPWLSLEVGRMQLANRPGFGDEPMVSLDGASIGLRLLSLLSDTVEVGEIRLDGAAVRLRVNEDGTNNWEDIVAASEAQAEASAEEDDTDITVERDVRLQVAGIAITDTSLVYDDREAGTRFELSEANLRSSGLGDSGPSSIDGGFRFALEPDGPSGTVELQTDVEMNEAGARLTELSLTADIVNTDGSELPVSLEADAIALNSDESFATDGLALTVSDAVARLTLAGTQSEAGTTASGRIETNVFSLKTIIDDLELEPVETADASALTELQLTGDLSLTPTRAAVGNLILRIDDTTFRGELGADLGETTHYTFTLAGDSIDADRYLAPTDETETATDSGAADDTPLPAGLIDTLSADGKLTLETATLGGLEFRNITLGLTAGDRQLRLHPLSADLFGGNYQGDIRMETRGAAPRLAIDERVNAVQLGPLAKAMFDTDNLSGTLAGRFTLNGTGDTLAGVRQTLAGNVAFALSDGALEGRDLWYQIRRARALFRQEAPPPAPDNPRTEFSDVSGTGTVTDGVLSNDDFSAALPFLQVTGGGTVDIAANTIDYRMRARVLERPEFLEGATDAELDEYTEAVIPLKIEGPLTEASIVPDIGGLVRERLRQEVDERRDAIKDRLLERIGLGGESDDGTADEPAAEGGEDEPVDPEDALKDKAREELNRLFNR